MYGSRESLRDLLAAPERLDELLERALVGDDAILKQLAHNIRRQPAAPAAVGHRRATPLRWAILTGVIALLVVTAFLLFQLQSQPAATPVTATAPPAAAQAWPERLVLHMHGSNTMGEKLAPALLEAWQRSQGADAVEITAGNHPLERSVVANLDVRKERQRVELHAHGSGTAFEDMAAGRADIGMSSRRIKSDEAQLLAAQFGDLRSAAGEHVIGLDGLAVIVHAENPIQTLTIAQVAALFSGEISTWSQLDPRLDGPVVLHARNDKSGTFDTFVSLVLKPAGRELSGGAKRYESSGELANEVAGDPDAIGFVGLPYVGKTRALGIAKTAESLPVLPTAFTVGTEDYPLARRLYLYASTGAVAREIDDFIRFALSEKGQEVVTDAGLVSLNPRLQAVPLPPDAPQDYRRLTEGASRLSLNFRFEAGSDTLDTRGQRDLQRLIEFIGANPGRSLLLFGFSDSAGRSDANVALSQARAEQLARALQSRGVFAATVHGFGSALPVASNDSAAGRERNRRVEVWLR